MTTIDILKELIRSEARVELQEDYDKYFCCLEEPDSDYTLTISNLPKDTIIIKSDKFPEPKKIFIGSKMECKRADFVIITSLPKKCIVFLELKRSKSSASPQEIVAQFRGAKCLMEYCKAIGKEFWKDSDFLEGYEQKYIKYVSKINKRASTFKSSTSNDTPETATSIVGRSNVPFRQLLS